MLLFFSVKWYYEGYKRCVEMKYEKQATCFKKCSFSS